MPNLNEVKRDYEIGKGHKSNKWIWLGCSQCGKERWVQLVTNEPINARCSSCVSKTRQFSPERCRKISESLRREHSPRWKGGISISRGYVTVNKPEHPRATKRGYVKRAILVLEDKLGRPITAGFDSHHINGIKNDDRPENLQEIEHGVHGRLTMVRIWTEETLKVNTK